MSRQTPPRIFLRDTIKKSHGFLQGRRRKLAYTDALIHAVFDKLQQLVAQRLVERFRVVFGSDIVELRMSANPLLPATYRTDQFLATDFSTLPPPSIDPAKKMPFADIPEILSKMKELRLKETRFLEAFRINSCAGSIWAFFSSGQSLFGDHRNFLAYFELRDEQERVNAEMDTLLAFSGDEFERLANVVVREQESEADIHFDAINAKTTALMQGRHIFEFQMYCGSGLIRAHTTGEPHTPRHFTVEQYLEDQTLQQSEPVILDNGIPPDTRQLSNRMSAETLQRLMDLAVNLRSGDDELYLRVLYVDVVTNTVVTSFSCGGTYCQTAEEFVDSEFVQTFS